MAEKTSELSHGSVVWARMPGFAPWPARICSAFEKKKLMLQKTSKPNDIPVTFFGMRNESGWVIDTSVSLFTGESWKSKFDKKKFKSDKNYRAGVLEAVLLTKAKGQKYPSEVADLLTDTTKEFQDKVNHLCATCTGSSLSGDLTTCIYCDVIEVHWHCFHPDDPLVDEKFWICENCCKINKLEKGSVLTREQLLGNNKNESTSTTQITNSKNTEKNDEEGTSSKDKKKSSRKSLGDEKASTSTDHHHNSNASNKTGDNRLSSATIPRIESVEDDIINKDEDEVDDQCFVCGQDGELLMCDFPDCPRVYHPVCIMKIAPKPLTIDTCNDIYSNDITSSNNDDNLWFCPKHFCTICGILEKSKYTSVGLNQSLLLPSNLYLHAKELQYQSNFLPVSQAEQKNGTSSNLSSSPGYKTLWEFLNQSRTTRSCRTCPFTICNECEKNVYPHIQLFKGKRGHPHYSQCRNCAVPSDEVKLAKQLENAWVKIASSRLALPFLRPLLPFTSTSANPSSSSSSTLENQQQLESASYESRGDLTLILEHIHSLKYHSTKEFEEDLFSFRDYVYQKLYDYLKQFDKIIPSSSSSCASVKQQNEDILRKHDLTKVFYHSFETILEAGRNYIFSREIVFKEIEEEMRKKQLPQQTEVSAQPSSSSSSGRRGRRSRKRKQSESVEEERLSISEHQEPSGKAEDVMEVEEPSSHTEKEVSETVENGEMVVTNFDETSAIHEEMKKTEFKEVEAENVEAELDKEEMFLQKLWRIFCHKDPLHSLTKTLNHQNTISTVVSSTEDNQSSLPRFSSPSCFTQLYYDLPPRQITTNSTSATSSSPLPLIIPRSFQSWQQYLQEGIMPSKYLSNRLNDPTKALSNQKILQIRNQLLLNEETAFSAGPKETNETAKFNIFDHKFSKKVVKDLLFFHEDDEKRKMPVKMEIDKIDENQEKILNSDEILSQLKEEANQGNTHLQEEYEVANLLYSLNHDGNYTRENVTLATPFSKTDQQTPADAFELLGNSSLSSNQLRDTVLDPSLAPYQTMQTKITETPVFDETFVILNHLQSITEQTLALQMKLKQEYLRKQEQLFQYNHDVISFGELRLVTELKLANDNLRWRLEQRNVILQKYKETNQKLRLQLQQSEERTKELELQLQESKKSNGGNVVSEELSQQKLSLVERAVELTSAVERETSVGNGETVSDASTPITQEGTANGSVNDDQSGTVTRGKRRKVQS